MQSSVTYYYPTVASLRGTVYHKDTPSSPKSDIQAQSESSNEIRLWRAGRVDVTTSTDVKQKCREFALLRLAETLTPDVQCLYGTGPLLFWKPAAALTQRAQSGAAVVWPDSHKSHGLQQWEDVVSDGIGGGADDVSLGTASRVWEG